MAVNGMDRRLRRLEGENTVALPWHLPFSRWTDAQLHVVAGTDPDAGTDWDDATEDQLQRLAG